MSARSRSARRVAWACRHARRRDPCSQLTAGSASCAQLALVSDQRFASRVGLLNKVREKRGVLRNGLPVRPDCISGLDIVEEPVRDSYLAVQQPGIGRQVDSDQAVFFLKCGLDFPFLLSTNSKSRQYHLPETAYSAISSAQLAQTHTIRDKVWLWTTACRSGRDPKKLLALPLAPESLSTAE